MMSNSLKVGQNNTPLFRQYEERKKSVVGTPAFFMNAENILRALLFSKQNNNLVYFKTGRSLKNNEPINFFLKLFYLFWKVQIFLSTLIP